MEVMTGERWGIVGTNGAGKSTLLRAIIGTQRIESGTALVRPRTSVGYLEQKGVSGSEKTVFEEAASQMERLQEAERALAKLEHDVENAGDGLTDEMINELVEAQEEWEAAGGADAEKRVSNVLGGLGFTQEDQEKKCSEFSGGWQMRIALARLLLSEPQLLLLDEPTNHLDLASRDWLAGYLAKYSGTTVIVSHDVALLNSVTHVAEVINRGVEKYKGGYKSYLTQREERAALAVKTYEAQMRQAEELQSFIDRFGAKATKAAQANSRKIALDKLKSKMVEPPSSGGRGPSLKLMTVPRGPLELIEIRGEKLGEGASLGYTAGMPLLSGVNLKVTRGMRLLLLGPNGAGKSTLLASLADRLPLLSGVREAAPDLEEGGGLAMFRQDLAQELDQSATAVDEVLKRAPLADAQMARNTLGGMGLGAGAKREIKFLSGGEKARVALAAFALQPLQVFLADEPSNHLDSATMAMLQSALGPQAWGGALVLSSHDRAFCEGMGFTHVAHVRDGKVTVFDRPPTEADWATVHDGEMGKTESAFEAAAAEVKEKTAEEKKAERLEEEKERKERAAAPGKMKKLEAEIAKAEQEVVALDAKMLAEGSDVDRVLQLSKDRDAAQAKVDAKYQEYERLEKMVANDARRLFAKLPHRR